MEIELERTFLAKYLPTNLNNYPFKDMIDVYMPKNLIHPVLRLRKNGEKYVLTKKYIKNGTDASEFIEETIILSKEEYDCLNQLDGKKLHKTRYKYDYNDLICEIDVFLDELKGLVLVDFEFKTKKEMLDFKMPDFCLFEVTQDEFVAGGMLCGKSYDDIKKDLDKFNYKKIDF